MPTRTRDHQDLARDLRLLLPDTHVGTTEKELRSVETDYYWPAVVGSSAGTPLGRADVVVCPRGDSDVSRILAFASERGIPVVPRGGGSGTQGAAVPIRGGIVLDMRSMDRILEVDEENYTVTVEAGVNGAVLEEHLNSLGLMCPHYPASAELATVGGYLAALGSGVLSTRYGKIEDIVVSLRAVLPNGHVVPSLPVPRHGAGPDAARLMVGAEGTLGVITEVTLRVIPLPAARKFATTWFPNVTAGVAAYRAAMVKGVRPAVLRLYDKEATAQSLSKVISGTNVGDGVLSVEMYEGEAPIVAAEQSVMSEITAQHGARQLDAAIAQQWWDHRYDFYRPPHYPQLPAMWGTLDVVAPYRALVPAYEAVREAVGKRYAATGLQMRTHFSHWYPWGAMFYGRFVIPEPQGDLLALHDEIWEVGMKAVLDAGALINDHHGVGIKLAPFMQRQQGENLELFRAIKGAVDPKGIMNPGKLGIDG
jgi:alkyldihydroxyacetonephosphate synthase